MKSAFVIFILLLLSTLAQSEVVGMRISIFSERDGGASYDIKSDIKDWNQQNLDTKQICDLLAKAENPYGFAVVLLIQSQRNTNDEHTRELFKAINSNKRLILSYYNTTHPYKEGFPTRKVE